MFLKNLLSYSSVSLLAQFMVLTQGFIVRRLLVPDLMGIWNYVGVTQNFVSTFDLGITMAAGRDLPLLHGAGQYAEEQRTRSTALWARMLQSAVLAGGLFAFGIAGLISPGLSLFALMVATTLVVTSAFNEAMTTFFQSAQQYVRLGQVTLSMALASAVVIPAATWAAGLPGLMVAAVAMAIAQSLALVGKGRAAGVTLTAECHWPTAWRMVTGFGLPLRLTDYPMSVLLVADSLFVARYFPAAELALYATAKVLFLMAVDIPARMGNVVLSRLYTLSGTGVPRRALGDDLRRYFVVQHLALMPLLLSTVGVASHVVVALLIPKYVDALAVADILLVAVYFMPSTTLIRNFWLIDRRFTAIFWSNLAGLAGTALGLVASIELLGWKLEAVAIATIIGVAIHFLVLLSSIGREVWGRTGALIVGAWAILGSVYCGVILNWVIPPPSPAAGVTHVLTAALTSWCWCQLALVPLYAVAAWRGNLMAFARQLTAPPGDR